MGVLVAKRYPTALFANQADHTYVQCSTGATGWGCWGGKSGGTELRRATGSTLRANCVARPDEKAGIKCYLINGVCHQAANRILLAAGITVRGARGYSISEALFGTYGRVGMWPCSSPFNKCASVTGDSSACTVAAMRIRAASAARSEIDQLDWAYIQSVLALYKKGERIQTSKSATSASAKSVAAARRVEAFHVELFEHMAAYKLGPLLDPKLERRLRAIRRETERRRMREERAFAAKEIPSDEFVARFNQITIDFQNEMASAMKPSEYVTLFDLEPGDNVVLADQKIVKKAFA